LRNSDATASTTSRRSGVRRGAVSFDAARLDLSAADAGL
jgi:hypothetical protein